MVWAWLGGVDVSTSLCLTNMHAKPDPKSDTKVKAAHKL